MHWIKTVDGAKTVYTAPPELAPIVRVIHDPDQEGAPWCVCYSYLQEPGDTPADIEEVIEVEGQ